jgi:hypothetical protein
VFKPSKMRTSGMRQSGASGWGHFRREGEAGRWVIPLRD